MWHESKSDKNRGDVRTTIIVRLKLLNNLQPNDSIESVHRSVNNTVHWIIDGLDERINEEFQAIDIFV